MRLRNIPGAEEILNASEYVVKDPASLRGAWRSLFEAQGDIATVSRQDGDGEEVPDVSRADPEGDAAARPQLHIEIGMGKGGFLHRMSALHPDVMYVGLEQYSSVLVKAVSKLTADPRDNVRLICGDAKALAEYFEPGEVDRIYLNFSDPWPKARHAKRRLPGRAFLALYNRVLSPDGRLEFKTDNRELFDFALEEAAAAGWQIEALTYDLHRDEVLCRGNVMTEYEEKFSQKGNPICKYIIYRKVEP
ncbi:MAG: tRNA (guanosine(46)-N7)-methyltransferase TrmB [Lachnospiraceae bacterium]|nr:tRNA (guanosine(46)-N7)-methyltransferase TrmB [Lachnospiraceae bacterium]